MKTVVYIYGGETHVYTEEENLKNMEIINADELIAMGYPLKDVKTLWREKTRKLALVRKDSTNFSNG